MAIKGDSTKIGVIVPAKTHERCSELAEATGQTFASVVQMALTVGLSHLEPQVYGNVLQKQGDSIDKLTAVFESMMQVESKTE